MARWILHVDLDRFMVAVEVLRRPELAGRPVVVGGHSGTTERGVVSAASREATAFGIKERMALSSARRRCPEAVFLPIDVPVQLEASRTVMAALRAFPADVQLKGLGEASLTLETDDPQAIAREVQRAVLGAAGLSCTVGVGDTALRAQTASGLAEPRGVFTLTREDWADEMGARATDALVGIDRARAAKLRALGIRTVSELASADEGVLADAFGPRLGALLRFLATGEDPCEPSEQQ
jgi:DNA polymerase IV